MLKLSLKQQLIASFCTLAVISLILGSISFFGSRALSNAFIEYREIARNSLATSDLSVDLLTARSSALSWRTSGNPEAADQLRQSLDQVIARSQARDYAEIQAWSQSYMEAFNTAVTHQQARERAFVQISALGPQIRMNLTEVMQSAYNDGDPEAAYYAGMAQERLMLGRFYAERFLVDNAQASATRAQNELQTSFDALNTLLPLLQNPQRRTLTQGAMEGLAGYQQGFSDITTAIVARNGQLDRMDEIGPLMSQNTASIRQNYMDQQNDLGPKAQQNAQITQMLILIAGLIAVGFSFALGLVFAFKISSSIQRIVGCMRALATGDKMIDIPGARRSDEIGDMARALTVFKTNAQEVEQLELEQKQAAKRLEEESNQVRMKMADDFEQHVGEIISTLATSSEDLQIKASELTQSIATTTERSNSVGSAAHQASNSVESVASASEQLTASIREVSTQVNAASDAARSSSRNAEQSTAQLDRLQEAVAGVDEIVQSINQVAEQTNLLALNATIEAARAGEAGKGFAVVASEVKALAEQTTKLTEEIALRLNDIGTSSADAISATQKIISQIEGINTTTSALSATVDEQSAATGEISSSAQQAAEGARSVSTDISEVQDAVTLTQGVADSVQTTAHTVSSNSDELRIQVKRFLGSLRAA